MTTSISSCLFCSPHITINSKQSSHSHSSSVRYGRSRISAAYATATAERTEIRSISPVSLYEVLGVQIGADTQEVKSAYRRLARVLHPDVCESSADDFMKVHSAYATLADPVKRAEYDRGLLQRSARGFSRRWETDQCW